MKKRTILITSGGGQVGTFLLKHLAETGLPGYEYRLIAADMDEYVACKKWCDAFYHVPQTADAGYEPALLALLEKEMVDHIIPGTSYDLNFLVGWRNVKWGSRYLCFDPEIYGRLNNKAALYTWAKENGLTIPAVYTTPEAVKFPAIAKPVEGTGGKKVVRLDGPADMENYFRDSTWETSVVTQWIDGPEYTVDCLFGRAGELIGYSPRLRLKKSGGGAVVCRTVNDLDVAAILKAISNAPGVRGPVNFQVIENSGRLYLTDFNPRFASGGLPLAVACGFDIPNSLLQLLEGEEPPHYRPGAVDKTMVRYFEEYFY